MKTVVVAGQWRKVGKTAVMAGLIRGLRSWGWAAVKISTHRGRIPHLPGDSGIETQRFALREEKPGATEGDTARFLAAGARRALWLRARSEHFHEALPRLWNSLRRAKFVMIESNSIVDYLRPSVLLLVCDDARRGFKSSARRLLPKADAIVSVKSRANIQPRAEYAERSAPKIPVFAVSPPHYGHPKLRRFVLRKIQNESRSDSYGPRRDRYPKGSEHVGAEQKRNP